MKKTGKILLIAAALVTLLLLPHTTQAAGGYTLRFFPNGGTFIWPDGTVADGTYSGCDGQVGVDDQTGLLAWMLTVDSLDVMTQSGNVLAMADLWEYSEGAAFGSGGPPLRRGPGLRKEGYVIAGWYKDAACTKKSFSDQTEHYFETFRHYAKWVPADDAHTYKVVFDFNGGEIFGRSEDKVVFRVAKGEPILEQRDRALRYVLLDATNLSPLVYWSTDPEGKKPVNSPGSIVPKGNMVFYAQYRASGNKNLMVQKKALTLKEGESAALSVDDCVKGGRLSWSSDDPDSVWVDQNGNVTAAEDIGTSDKKVKITLTPYGKSSPSATCTVTVKSAKKEYTVTTLDGETETYTGKVGETITVKAGTPGTGRRFSKWQITPSVTFLNGTGLTSKTVTFRLPDAAVKMKAIDEPIPLKGVTFSPKTMKLSVGQSKPLTLVTSPAGAPYQKIEYWSTDENVATVDLKGVVHAHSGGSCTVSVTVNGKFKASCKVTVPRKAVQKVAFNKSKLTLKKGKKSKLKLKVTPAAGWYNNVSWFCSESKVASVSAKGLVTAKGKGKCKITCTITTLNGKKKKATCKLTVK